MREILGWSCVVLAALSVLQRRPIRSVFMRLALSTTSVAVYFLYMAPDVALTEAMLGGLLTTFVYILMLRTPSTLRVGYVPVRFLFEEHPWGFDGIEHDILKRFAAKSGYTIEYVRFDEVDEMLESLKSGFLDVACGPVVDFGYPVLETKVFILEDGTKKDFLSMTGDEKVVSYEKAYYRLAHVDFEELEEFLDDMKRTGELEKVVKKYAG